MPCGFQHCLQPVNMLTAEGLPEIENFGSLSSYLFRSQEFRKLLSYEIHPFFSKYWKFDVEFRNAMKNGEKDFGFWDNIICICGTKFTLLWKEYLWLTVNVLKSCANISNITKSNFLQLSLFQINGTVVQTLCHAYLSSVWDPLTHWLPNG